VGATVVGGVDVAGTVVGVVVGAVGGVVVGATVGATVGGATVVGGTVAISADDGAEADALTTVETGTGKVAVAFEAVEGSVDGDPGLDDPVALETDALFGVPCGGVPGGPCGDAPCGNGTAAVTAGGGTGVGALRAVFASADLLTGLMNETVGTGDPLVSDGWLPPDVAAALSPTTWLLIFDVGVRVGFTVVGVGVGVGFTVVGVGVGVGDGVGDGDDVCPGGFGDFESLAFVGAIAGCRVAGVSAPELIGAVV
jgi:hypothetical protein